MGFSLKIWVAWGVKHIQPHHDILHDVIIFGANKTKRIAWKKAKENIGEFTDIGIDRIELGE